MNNFMFTLLVLLVVAVWTGFLLLCFYLTGRKEAVSKLYSIIKEDLTIEYLSETPKTMFEDCVLSKGYMSQNDFFHLKRRIRREVKFHKEQKQADKIDGIIDKMY